MVRNNQIQFVNSNIVGTIRTTSTTDLTLVTPLEPAAVCVGSPGAFDGLPDFGADPRRLVGHDEQMRGVKALWSGKAREALSHD
jgi:hypothetical protein